MIRIIIDWEPVLRIIDRVIIWLIISKAYKGHCYWMKINNNPLCTFAEYKAKKFNVWKYIMGFKTYLYQNKIVRDWDEMYVIMSRKQIIVLYFKSIFK